MHAWSALGRMLWFVIVSLPPSSRYRAARYTIDPVRRALFIAILAVLMADASGITSLLAPETCSVTANETGPDEGCPAFCVRCTCGCCASPIVPMVAATIAAQGLLPHVVPAPPRDSLPTGNSLDILHVPKTVLT